MRNTRRIAVVLTGVAIASAAASVAAPAVQAATSTGVQTAVHATVAKGGHDCSSDCGRGHGGYEHGREHGGYEHGYGHGGYEHGYGHGGGHYGGGHHWRPGHRQYGHYRSYRECWDAGLYGRRNDRWSSYDCYEVDGHWELDVC
jgi:Ni/Co efflux regulator RcnB